ncbi:hypothetical protein D1007_58176 [Hordeum vulgare]|nr:hypothetical protein D1007_58176 [Hordeum vulgare]
MTRTTEATTQAALSRSRIMARAGEPDAAGTARSTKDPSRARTLGHNDEWDDDDEQDHLGDTYGGMGTCPTRREHELHFMASYLLDKEDMESDGESSQLPHDLMKWLSMNIDTDKRELRLIQNKVIIFTRDMVKKVFNIPSGNRTVELFKRHEQCDLRNISHKNGMPPISHTVDVLHKARNDDGDTTKRSWVLLALATVLTPCTGNMVPLVGSPKPQEEPVVLLSSREPSPEHDEEKTMLKHEKKVKSKKSAASLISVGPKYRKIKIDSKTEAMYE